MSLGLPRASRAAIDYPESDGQPIAENTLQYEWIVTIKGNLDGLFRDDPDVFIAGDLLWYPVEGHPEIAAAPDAMVAFGRPKGHRRSYRQFDEGGIAPQVVFEILSPSNRGPELARKLRFYDTHGVEEYYLYDPEDWSLAGYRREGDRLAAIPAMAGWVSPRLGIRFDTSAGELQIFRPDGQRFLTFNELFDRSEADRHLAAATAAEAERSLREAEAARRDAEREAHRADAATREAEAQRAKAERLLARLRELGVDPEA